MNITAEQRQTLYNYLKDIFRYRETLTEVYDHLLCSLENYEGDLPFQDAVNKTIQAEFGSHNKLQELEKDYETTANHDLKRQLWLAIQSNLKTTGALLTGIVAFLSFYLKLNILQPGFLIGVIILANMVPLFLYLLRPFRTGFLFGNKIDSVKDHILYNLAYIPSRLSLVAIFLIKMINKPLFDVSALPTAVTFSCVLIVYVALPVFALSYYQCFKKEYSLKFINN